jgi:class 3 adenylate cyclase
VLLQSFVRARERARAELEVERAKSEGLLLNVLPASVASRLKESDEVIADGFPSATVLFADIVGFTPLAQELTPADTVALLDKVFARWDSLLPAMAWKIKTIGDSYMVAGGLPLCARTTPRRSPIWRSRWARGRALRRGAAGRSGSHWHRHRARGCRRDWPCQVQLRPLGRHRQYGEPHGVRRAGAIQVTERAYGGCATGTTCASGRSR